MSRIGLDKRSREKFHKDAEFSLPPAGRLSLFHRFAFFPRQPGKFD